MSAQLVWVVGAGGLLGSAVTSALGPEAWLPPTTFRWRDAAGLVADFRHAIGAFAAQRAARGSASWAILWCAGAGVVGTSAAALYGETAAFGHYLELLGREPLLAAAPGAVVLASSAGGVYGGSAACTITEDTRPEPISPYGHAKLAQECALVDWAKGRPVATLVARFSNLYGPAQRLDKPQGLISHMSRCVIHNAPVHVYVSLDTIRDYLFSEDAGRRLVTGLRELTREAPATGRHVTKIYASERELSIAGLIGIFRQIARRRLRVVSGLSPTGALQPRRLRFRSRVWSVGTDRRVELVEGVSRVYRHQLACFGQGQLPPPRIT